MKSIIGIDIGGSKTAVVEGTFDGQILNRTEIPTNATVPFEQTLPILVSAVRMILQQAESSGDQVAAISVSVGGPIEMSEGVVHEPPHLPGWHGVRLRDRLREQFPSLPVHIEHDGNAGALAEFYFGVGRKAERLQHLVFLTLGTGLGAGIIVNGRILHGASNTAGEVGRLIVSSATAVGPWESFSSGVGMVRLASKMFPSRWTSNTPVHELIEAVLRCDKDATVVAHAVGQWIGRGLALLVDTLNPEFIVLGTLAVILGERLLAPAREMLSVLALPRAVAACKIVPTTFGKQIGDVASLMAAYNYQQTSGSL